MFRLNRAGRLSGDRVREVEHTLACVGLFDGVPELRYFLGRQVYSINFHETEHVAFGDVKYEMRFIPSLMRVSSDGAFVDANSRLPVHSPENHFSLQVGLSQDRGLFDGNAVFVEAARSLGYIGYGRRPLQLPNSPPETMVEDALREMVWMSKMIYGEMDNAACTLMGWW